MICDFYGFLAQVKTREAANIEVLPDQILGAAWAPQRDRMRAGRYFSLFIVQWKYLGKKRERVIFFLPGELQTDKMFVERKPSNVKGRSAPFVGFYILTKGMKDRFIKLA